MMATSHRCHCELVSGSETLLLMIGGVSTSLCTIPNAKYFELSDVTYRQLLFLCKNDYGASLLSESQNLLAGDRLVLGSGLSLAGFNLTMNNMRVNRSTSSY